MIAQLNTLAETGWTWSASMFWQVTLPIVLVGCMDALLRRRAWAHIRNAPWLMILVLIAVMGICILPMARAKPTQAQSPKEVKQKEPGQTLETLLSDFNHQQAKLKTALARLHQHTGQRKSQQQIAYVVQPGDTLAAIARRFYGRDTKLKETVAILRQANPEVAERGLRPGQTLRIPAHPARKMQTANPSAAQPDRDWEEELDHWLGQMQAWSDELNRTVQELNVEDRLQKAHTWKQELLSRETLNQWQQDLEAWQESEELRNWQQDIRAWSHKIERFVRGKTGDHPDPNGVPVPMPIMPTLPSLPAPPRLVPPPSAVNVPAAKPLERHRFEVVLQGESVLHANAGVTINNPHGNITLRSHQNEAAHTAVSFLVGGCSRAEAEKFVGPMTEALAAHRDQSKLHLTVELPTEAPLESLCVDVEVSLPGGIAVEARTNTGAIELANLSAEAKAHTNMGVISARNLSGDTECRSNMGAIRFITPTDPSIEVTASTHLGSVHTDLNLKPAADHNRMLKGRLGTGTQQVDLLTNMGAIHIGTEPFVAKQAAKDKPRQKQQKEGHPDSVATSVFSPATPSVSPHAASTVTTTPKPEPPFTTRMTQQNNRFVAARPIALAFAYKRDLPITVKNQDGSITVTGSDQQDSIVQGEIRCSASSEQAARNLLGKINMTPQTSHKGLLIQPTSIQNAARDQHVTVDLKIALSRDAVLAVHHEDGPVRIKDMHGPVRIMHEDGAIQCYRLQGPLAIHHEDGHILIEDAQGPLDIKLEDGTVTLDCSPDAKAPHAIKTSVLDGSIKLNVPAHRLGTEPLPNVQRKDSRARWRHSTDTLDIDLRVNHGSIKINGE